MTDQRIEKWTQWVEGRISDDILGMHLRRDFWTMFNEMLQDHGELPDSYFWQFGRENYGITQAVSVRRLADTHRDSGSLGKLIAEIASDPSRLTREWWIGLWDLAPDGDTMHDRIGRSYAERGWADQYGGSVGKHLDPAIPADDHARLERESEAVKAYVDQHIAHLDATPAPGEVTINDVHAAIDVIGDLFKKYSNLLTAKSWALIVPQLQHDWRQPFREAWIRPDIGVSGTHPGHGDSDRPGKTA